MIRNAKYGASLLFAFGGLITLFHVGQVKISLTGVEIGGIHFHFNFGQQQPSNNESKPATTKTPELKEVPKTPTVEVPPKVQAPVVVPPPNHSSTKPFNAQVPQNNDTSIYSHLKVTDNAGSVVEDNLKVMENLAVTTYTVALKLPKGFAHTYVVGSEYMVKMENGQFVFYNGCYKIDYCSFRCRSGLGELRDFKHLGVGEYISPGHTINHCRSLIGSEKRN